MAKTDEQIICCSFCGKGETQARLIAGPGVYICSDCVQACQELLRSDEQAQDGAKGRAVVARRHGKTSLGFGNHGCPKDNTDAGGWQPSRGCVMIEYEI